MYRPLIASLSVLALIASLPAPLPAQLKLGELEKGLKSKYVKARLNSVHGLGNCGAAAGRSVPELAWLLRHDPDGAMLNEVAKALAQIGVPALGELRQALRDENPRLRQRAAWALARFGPDARAAVPDLIDALKDTQPAVRAHAAAALGEIGADARAAVERLVAAVRDRSPEVRMQALNALGLIGPDAVAPLAKVLDEDTDDRVRGDAARVLAFYGKDAKPAIPALIRAARDRNSFVRLAALATLGAVGTDAKEALPVLLEALESKNLPTQTQAFQSILQVGSRDLPELLKTLRKINDKADWAAPFLLPQFGPLARNAIGPLTDALQDRNAGVRMGAAVALGQVGKDAADALPALGQLLQDTNPSVQLAAMSAIRQITGLDQADQQALGLLTQQQQQWLKLMQQVEQQAWQSLSQQLTDAQKAIDQRLAQLALKTQANPGGPTTNWEAFHDATLRQLYARVFQQYVTGALASRAGLGKEEKRLAQDQAVRDLLKDAGPEAIPALVDTLNLVQQFKQGFC